MRGAVEHRRLVRKPALHRHNAARVDVHRHKAALHFGHLAQRIMVKTAIFGHDRLDHHYIAHGHQIGRHARRAPARAVGVQFARPSHIFGGDHRLAQGFPLYPQPRGIIAQFQHHRRLPLCHIAGQIHHVGQGFAPSGLIPQNLGWQGLTRAAPQALVTVKLFQPLLQRTGCDFL